MTFEVRKQERESNQSLIRRFTKRIRQSGIMAAAKRAVFYRKPLGEEMQKQIALRRIEKRAQKEKARKMGIENDRK